MSDLNQLAANAAETEKTVNPFMQPEVKSPVKKGRPPMTDEEKKQRAENQKKSASAKKPTELNSQDPSPQAAPPPPLIIDSKKIMKPVCIFISNAGVNYVGDQRASMTPDEMDAIADGLGLVLDKYAPLIFEKYGAEAMLCIALGGYGLRITAMKKVLEIEKKQFQEKQNAPRPVQDENNVSTLRHE